MPHSTSWPSAKRDLRALVIDSSIGCPSASVAKSSGANRLATSSETSNRNAITAATPCCTRFCADEGYCHRAARDHEEGLIHGNRSMLCDYIMLYL